MNDIKTNKLFIFSYNFDIKIGLWSATLLQLSQGTKIVYLIIIQIEAKMLNNVVVNQSKLLLFPSWYCWLFATSFIAVRIKRLVSSRFVKFLRCSMRMNLSFFKWLLSLSSYYCLDYDSLTLDNANFCLRNAWLFQRFSNDFFVNISSLTSTWLWLQLMYGSSSGLKVLNFIWCLSFSSTLLS